MAAPRALWPHLGRSGPENMDQHVIAASASGTCSHQHLWPTPLGSHTSLRPPAPPCTAVCRLRRRLGHEFVASGSSWDKCFWPPALARTRVSGLPPRAQTPTWKTKRPLLKMFSKQTFFSLPTINSPNGPLSLDEIKIYRDTPPLRD
jgi:hypothetical protein